MKHKTWLLDGLVHSAPGIIELNGSQLTLTLIGSGTFGDNQCSKYLSEPGAYEVLQKENLIVFNVKMSEIKDSKFPWYSFGAGCRLEIDNNIYKLSFVQPQNTKFPTNRLGDIGGDLQEGARFGNKLKKLLKEYR
jgi:hypothetical protein